jgi:nucleoside-diphosphate-sugar epimerase
MNAGRIALTGATGFIGRATAATLLHDGWAINALVRPERVEALDGLNVHCVHGSMRAGQTHEALLEGADVLVHNAVDWAPLRSGDLQTHLDHNLVAGIELFEAAARRGLRIVFVSSVSVHHEMLDQWNGHIDDAHPTRPGGLYGALKASLEAHLWSLSTQHGTAFTALRPAAVYGIDPQQTRSIGWPIVECLLRGDAWSRAGGGKFVHIDDVAACIAGAAKGQHEGGRLHHLADCYARWSDWTCMAAECLGLNVDIQHTAPDHPKNMFMVDDVKETLGVALNRGHAGIREHIEHLIRIQRGSP